jgi:adenosylhomocysteine nucleosidase
MSAGTGDPVWHSGSPAARVAVIAALEIEARIPRALGSAHRSPVYVSGPGSDRALAAARRAIAAGARALVSFGLAGGIGPDAATADIVLPETIASDAGSWAADTVWRQRLALLLQPGFRLVEGRLFSASDVVATPAAKAELAQLTGAVAVDMESAGVAAAAAEAGLPCIALRAVADGPDDALPENVASLVGPDGRTRPAAVAAFVLSPRSWRSLLGLAARSRDARAELTRALQALVRSAS